MKPAQRGCYSLVSTSERHYSLGLPIVGESALLLPSLQTGIRSSYFGEAQSYDCMVDDFTPTAGDGDSLSNTKSNPSMISNAGRSRKDFILTPISWGADCKGPSS